MFLKKHKPLLLINLSCLVNFLLIDRYSTVFLLILPKGNLKNLNKSLLLPIELKKKV